MNIRTFATLVLTAALTAAIGVATPAQAEIVQASENGFVTRDVVVVRADAKTTWLALISPRDWWSSQHTWSADAGNLRLTPQAGGCFCEKIPEVVTPKGFTLEGSVEHMRVIQAYPESALRMVGALGPLQSEPVTGVLTIALTEIDTPQGRGTRIVWEYNVGGPMRYQVPIISKAVDAVMSLQLDGLAQRLGKIDMPVERPAPQAPPAALNPQATPGNAPGNAPGEAGGSSVDEAFDDLGDPGR